MPEYLAPGVYVEETSFRAKSIEGVGTSTTAFVGPTRKGPIVPGTNVRADLPELVTNLADFVRLYGGLEPLSFQPPDQPNYLAQSVFNYFNEGGGRLYVMRVASGATPAQRALAGTLGQDSTGRVVIRSRFAGSGTNGQFVVREILSSGTAGVFRQAQLGALARGRSAVPTEPARLFGNAPAPFAVPHEAILRVQVNAPVAPIDITFRGSRSEAVSAGVLAAADLTLVAVANRSLTVEFDGVAQTAVIPARNYVTPSEIVVEVNAALQGGYARLNAGNLVIGTDRRGHAHTVHVEQNATFGFAADADSAAAFDAVNNNVADLGAVTVAEIQSLFNDAGNNPRVVAQLRGGRLELSTPQPEETQTIEVLDAERAPPPRRTPRSACPCAPPASLAPRAPTSAFSARTPMASPASGARAARPSRCRPTISRSSRTPASFTSRSSWRRKAESSRSMTT